MKKKSPTSNKALCDLGASINLMPFFINEEIGIGDVKNTRVILVLTNRSSVQPKEVLEDVLVKLYRFIIPADFVILDFEEDCEMPILLGRPFLSTSRSTIDLEKNELTMKINGGTKIFNVVTNRVRKIGRM
ncbi:Retrovirus-related Pol polyprotein from transposon opus [Gossypium australe]|uniref:Retrovirus-related Pol polyprotein from transposon opus n=1 Tax=Gossypium australe TaxID=47621 RepID=A0A5B6VAN9_9ROSI|nr:Retrovirus-related Pol polyprotein from transposon opus [Gossypium australe]